MNRPFEDSFPISESGECGIAETRDEVILRYLDAEMQEEEEAAFLDHVLYCVDCTKELRLRERAFAALGSEPVEKSTLAQARPRIDFNHRASTGQVNPWFGTVWGKLAAVFVFLATVSISWYYFISPQPHAWSSLATLDRSEYKPHYMQNQDNSEWQLYNEGIALLFRSQHEGILLRGTSHDEPQVRQAIRKLEQSMAFITLEDRQMDNAYFLSKAYLMIGDPGKAITWLEMSAVIAVNRQKIERAYHLCEAIDNELQAQIRSATEVSEKQRLTQLHDQALTARKKLKTLLGTP